MGNNKIKIQVTNVFRRNEQAKAKTVINQGGAGSSKTYSLCQFFIFNRLLKRKNYRLLILRKTRHANRLSVYEEFIGLLKEYSIYSDAQHNKSDLIYRIPELGSYVRFTGLDDYQQVKSTQWHDIWIEEANEITKKEYLFLLSTRLYRGRKKDSDKSRLWMSLNPEQCWIKDIVGQPDVEIIQSTWRDNLFCNKEYIQALQGLKEQDEALWQIFDLGQWAELRNIIYKPYIMETSWPKTFDEIIYGLDFGFNNPTVLLEIGIKDRTYWISEKIYQTRLTNQDLLTKLTILIPQIHKHRYMYADSAEPARIQEIANAGFNIVPADKSVKDGIDFCRRQVFHTNNNNVNMNRERVGYKYKEDKDGNVIDDPVKFNDHAMDAKRYAVYTHNLSRQDMPFELPYAVETELFEAPYELERELV